MKTAAAAKPGAPSARAWAQTRVPRSAGQAALACRRSTMLSLMFLAVYSGCNWITARRADVSVWYFAWEQHIPFLPLTIVPYLSIDAFFIAAPFLCRDRAELDVFTRRVIVAILAAGTCFLMMPLRFAFERPVVPGWPGALFQAFGSLDRPFNLFPSLHIALAVILTQIYWRRTRGGLRVALASWFTLIGLSTVLTYQHHIIDVAGGLALAAIVFFHCVRETPIEHSSARNLRVAGYYWLCAGVAACLTALMWPAIGVLIWPAVGFAIGGSAYAGLGPGVFRKSNGKIPVSAWAIVWPCLVTQWISLLYYRRSCRPYDQMSPCVWIGGRLSERDAEEAIQHGVTGVLDLTAELSEARAFRRVIYKNIPILDLTAPTLTQLQEAAAFITEQSGHGIVYVHCKIGYSRSAAATGAYLMAAGRARTADEAIAIIRAARPSIIVRPEAVTSLRRFEAMLTQDGMSREMPQSTACALIAALLAGLARLMCGSPPRWVGCQPSLRQRIYFANHTSHLDFLVLWGSLPSEVRARTRPVAGRDYWNRTRMRRYLADRVFRAVLIDRGGPSASGDRNARITAARGNVERTANALGVDQSLIIFPEGTRGEGPDVGPFKSGLYHLCRLRPDVELVPVYLENLNRILPKGEVLPVPLAGSITFGRPLRLTPGEGKDAFLARARGALREVRYPCTGPSTPILHASSAA